MIYLRTDNQIQTGIIDLRHTLNDFLKDPGRCGYRVYQREEKKKHAGEIICAADN